MLHPEPATNPVVTVEETPPTPVWTRSSFCGTGACVEVAHVAGRWLVRDSKQPDAGTLEFTVAEWDAFVKGAQAGEFHFG